MNPRLTLLLIAAVLFISAWRNDVPAASSMQERTTRYATGSAVATVIRTAEIRNAAHIAAAMSIPRHLSSAELAANCVR